MAATDQDITFWRGEDVTIITTIAGSGSIAGWTFAATFRRSFAEKDSVSGIIVKTSADGITIADAAQRIVHVTLTDDDTLLFDDGVASRDYAWDLKRTNAGSEAVLTVGTATVKNPGTR